MAFDWASVPECPSKTEGAEPVFRCNDGITVVCRLLALPVALAVAAGTAGHAQGQQGMFGAATATCADETPPGAAPRFGAGSTARNYGAIALDGVGAWALRTPTGIRVNYQGRHYRLLKAFAYVLRKPPAAVTVTVASPKSVRLYYPSGTVWASGPSAAQIVRGADRTVSLAACAGLTGYTGGLLIEKPICVTLRITEAGIKTRLVHVPIAPSACPK